MFEDATAISPKWYLSAVTVFKNEASYLDEWLSFCLLQGVEHFVLYDNSSTDNSREVLEPWIAAGIVDVIDWPLHWKRGAQTKAFLDALSRLRERARWTAFIDIDEFLFSPTGEPVADVLKQYEEHAGVIVNWQCYGSSGHKVRPSGLTIENYVKRARTNWARNRRVKTIVDPSRAVEPQSAHLFRVRPGEALVTEEFKRVEVVRKANSGRRLRHLAAWLPYLPIDPYSRMEPSIRKISVSKLRINHYVTRSKDEVRFKYKDRDTLLDHDRRTHARYHDRNEVEDPILVREAARVREIMAAVRSGRLPNQQKQGQKSADTSAYVVDGDTLRCGPERSASSRH